MALPTAARLMNLMLAGALTGNKVGSRISVHPALEQLEPDVHLRAEQAVTRSYGRVMPMFMSSTIASFLPVLGLERDRRAPAFLLTLAGLACYGGCSG